MHAFTCHLQQHPWLGIVEHIQGSKLQIASVHCRFEGAPVFKTGALEALDFNGAPVAGRCSGLAILLCTSMVPKPAKATLSTLVNVEEMISISALTFRSVSALLLAVLVAIVSISSFRFMMYVSSRLER